MDFADSYAPRDVVKRPITAFYAKKSAMLNASMSSENN